MFATAGIAWEDLEYIYADYFNRKYKIYQQILSDFEKEYLGNISDKGIHSYRTRIKDAEHLIVKIIRKRHENYKKYRNLDKHNYEKFLTDLIGIRCFILFKTDWAIFHQYILGKIENNPQYYIDDCLKDFDNNIEHCYMAEKPKVHIRTGDSREIYEKLLEPDAIKSQKIYRSVHYIIKYHGVYIEIQVRTLFEEGWGEIDHNMVYPYYQDDTIFLQYTKLLNRLAGLADEMGSFFCEVKRLELEHLQNAVFKDEKVLEDQNLSKGPLEERENMSKCPLEPANTPAACLDAVIRE